MKQRFDKHKKKITPIRLSFLQITSIFFFFQTYNFYTEKISRFAIIIEIYHEAWASSQFQQSTKINVGTLFLRSNESMIIKKITEKSISRLIYTITFPFKRYFITLIWRNFDNHVCKLCRIVQFIKRTF